LKTNFYGIQNNFLWTKDYFDILDKIQTKFFDLV